MSRRGILAAGAGAAGVAVLAACSGGSSGSDDGEGADVISPPASSPAPAATTAPASTSGAATQSTASGTPAEPLVTLAELGVGASKSVELADGKKAIVTRTGASSAVCFSAICTHQGCTVKPKGGRLDCPCHGSSFDARTGAVLGGPAPSPLPEIKVAVTGGAVVET